MSNNVLMIVLGPDGFYRAYDRCADNEYTETIGPIVYPDECGHGIEQPKFKVPTIEDAVVEAQNYMRDNIVEYGYHFLNLSEQNGEEKT